MPHCWSSFPRPASKTYRKTGFSRRAALPLQPCVSETPAGKIPQG
uniref:Uncharacterized protein n=1 Tax=Siphoviridae sp. ct1Eo1 TaxID=2825307 RepID=A0A8S5P6K5_9CAUD|nr:MAG TPA: hypothetical protein [Siphoviridae sp. ct1Eo1]